MATSLWGNVFYKNQFAGLIRQEPGDRFSFSYDKSYLDAGLPPISYTLPPRSEPYLTLSGLHPFFDNLVAEGWLEGAQTRLLGKRQVSRFELLLAFGQDCAGAVSVLDPSPVERSQKLMDKSDPKELALIHNRASLSGVQPKLSLVKREGKFYPSEINEVSTYIGKFPSRHHDDLTVNEYLTTLAYKALLPEDDVVDLWIGNIEGFTEEALIIKRFDRTATGEKIHFEEFNQLLGKPSIAKYDGAYKDMANFMRHVPLCLPAEVFRLYTRILCGLLLGNTDMHFKNFALLHTNEGLRLTPTYDQVAAALYDYKSVALAIGGKPDIQLGSLKAGNIIKLAQEFSLSTAAIKMAVDKMAENLPHAKEAIFNAKLGTNKFKDELIKLLEKRWNGTFALIGQVLLKKRSDGANNKN
jgi:serine/threonine-protein kinase HipA